MPRSLRLLALLLALVAFLILTSCSGITNSSGSNGGSGGGSTGATASPIKHVVVVIMQNHSFDNLFGMYPGDVDGIKPGVPGYTQLDSAGNSHTPIKLSDDFGDIPHGRQVYLTDYDSGQMDKFIIGEGTANVLGYYDSSNSGVAALWNLAKQNALADKFFTSVMSAAPTNQLFMVAANDNGNPNSVMPAYGPCEKSDPNAQPYTFQNVGDQLSKAAITWGWFQENYGLCADYVPQENPFQYFTSTHAASNLADYLQYKNNIDSGNTPAVSFVQIGPAKDTHPGSGPGSLANGLNWLNTFVQHVQSGPDWKSTAIIVVWDEGGGFWDHVAPPQPHSQGFGFRVPLLVISPYAKKNYVSHVTMDDTSILKFIHWNWKVSSLGGIEDSAGDMRDMFDFTQTP